MTSTSTQLEEKKKRKKLVVVAVVVFQKEFVQGHYPNDEMKWTVCGGVGVGWLHVGVTFRHRLVVHGQSTLN